MFDIAQAIEQVGLGTQEEFLQVVRSDTELIRTSPEAKR
jgi:hypothetical protein